MNSGRDVGSRRGLGYLAFGVVLGLLLVSVTLTLMLLGVIGGGTTLRSRVGEGYWKLDYVLDAIRNNYVDRVNMDSVEEEAIRQLIDRLDPHSVYLPVSENKVAMEPLRGDFEGIGVTFNMLTDTVIVQGVIADGPAERAGVLMGDRFLRVDSVHIAGVSMGQDSVMRLLRGPSGSEVRVEIARYGVSDPVELTIKRGRIPINSVEVSYMADRVTGVVRLSRFAATTSQDVLIAVRDLVDKGMERMVLDLRENGGGSIEGALFLASLFLQEGDPIIYTEGHNRPRHEIRSPSPGILRNMPLVVLIDEFSASASEIVAGALQDNDRAMVVGRRSFGKGLVQEVVTFPDGSALRLATQRYYIPSQRSIQKPYKLGDASSYESELERRWQHGELWWSDSVVQDTTQRYYTRGNRVVYGGGGIMPDVFIAQDTTMYTRAYQELVRRSMLLRFAQRYADSHRKALSVWGTAEDLELQLRKADAWGALRSFLATEGVRVSREELDEQRETFITLLHALIAQSVQNRASYYIIMQRLDPALQKGLELLATGKSRPRVESITTPTSGSDGTR